MGKGLCQGQECNSVVESMFSMCQILSSIPRTNEKKQGRRELSHWNTDFKSGVMLYACNSSYPGVRGIMCLRPTCLDKASSKIWLKNKTFIKKGLSLCYLKRQSQPLLPYARPWVQPLMQHKTTTNKQGFHFAPH
jgi:hypothetical protein